MPRGYNSNRAELARLALQEREFQQHKWEHSPEYLDQMLRTRLNAQNVQTGLESRDPAGTYKTIRDQETQKMQQKAQIDASLIETRYTAKDKANLAKIESQKKQGWLMLQRGEITPDEYERFQKQKQSEAMGVIPGNYPSLSPYPKGQGIGDVWEANGYTWSRKDNGELWQPDEKKSSRGVQMQQEADAIKEKAKLDAEERRSKEKFIDDLMKMKITSAEGERSLNPSEMKELMERRYPSTPMPSAEKVQRAKEYMQSVIQRYGDSPPQEDMWMMEEAQNIIKASTERAW